MIGKLTGRLDSRGPDHVIVDVGGVGYVVHVSDRTLAALPAQGGPVALHTELLVREDLLQLFGFLTRQEREWHRLLVTVQGVGARAALAILGALGADGVARAVAVGDAAAVRAAPGVGPKIAQRVVHELRGKAPALMAMAEGGGAAGTAAPPGPAPQAPAAGASAPAAPSHDSSPARPAAPTRPAATAEALSALTNLGYGPGDAAAAVAEAAGQAPDADTAALIRAALRLLAPAG